MSEGSIIDRRGLLGAASAMAAGVTLTGGPVAAKAPPGRLALPHDFLWGAATAGHQIEGNNTSSDLWFLESLKPSMFPVPSGDTCDSYHRYGEDIALLKGAGLNAYRFSIEWARIEPEEGRFSIAELDYYRRMIAALREAGIRPAVTFSHFTAPHWFGARGGWENPAAPDLFARYVARASKHLADLMHMAFTLNEANVPRLFAWLPKVRDGGGPAARDIIGRQAAINAMAAKAAGSATYSTFLSADPDKTLPQLISAHKKGVEAVKAQRGDLPVGVALSVQQIDAVGEGSRRDEVIRYVYDDWLEAAKTGDFVGVQTYVRWLADDKGTLPGPANGEVDMRGLEVFPAAVGNMARYVHERTGLPIHLSETGIATADDAQRIRYIDATLSGVRAAIEAGVPIKGYFHWTLIDNFEWTSHWTQTFGLAAVDRTTFKRTPKPSLAHLAAIARRNSI